MTDPNDTHRQSDGSGSTDSHGNTSYNNGPDASMHQSGEHQGHGHDHGSHDGHDGHDHMQHHKHMAEDFKKRFWISLVLTIPILLLAPMIQQFLGITKTIAFTGDLYLLFVFSSAVFFYGGYPFLKGLVDEVGGKQPGMMTLIGVAIIVAYVYSAAVVFGLSGRTFFWELATLIDVMLLGHWIEMKSVMSASRALEELAKLMPSEAHKVKESGGTEDVPVSDLNAGDKVIVKPGEKIPVDGSITEGSTSIDESMVTGESKPVSREVGAEVIGGSVNGEGSITVEVKKVGKDSYLSQVIEMVRQAQASKSKSQLLADRAALWLTIVALSAGAITLFVWLAFMHETFVFSLERTVTVMVITCPHALGLAIPLVVAVSTSLSAGYGLLIRNRGPFEAARNIQAIIFDKTGTLTKGTFEVAEVTAFSEDMDKDQVLAKAAAVESRSEHPIAKAIASAVENPGEAAEFQAIKGKGARAKVDGTEVLVVSPGYLRENDISVDESRVRELSEGGRTVVFVVTGNEVKGAIGLEDMVREESKEAIGKLKSLGVKTMMLTGDNDEVAKKVADEIGIDEYFAGVLPDKKAEKVKEVQSRGLVVAMVGDGVNDAPALAQANVGIAIGAGTDVAAETADIILVRNNPLDVIKLLHFSRATYKKMVQNLIYATGYNVVAIPLAAGVLYSVGILLSPAAGALLMSLSTVVVAINARFLRVPEAS